MLRVLSACVLVLVLAACSDPDAGPGYTVVSDAGVGLCPHVGSPGVLGASWFSNIGCFYSCDPATHSLCGDPEVSDAGRQLSNGTCEPITADNNCGGCGVRCASNERCTMTRPGVYGCALR